MMPAQKYTNVLQISPVVGERYVWGKKIWVVPRFAQRTGLRSTKLLTMCHGIIIPRVSTQSCTAGTARGVIKH